MRVAIIDDEPLAREILEEYVKNVPSLELVGVCKNAIEAFALLGKNQIDLLLLDINLPEVLGTEFLKILVNPPMVIFTTAYSQYAIESYELNAVDYLLKPFSFDRFVLSINKAKDLIEKSNSKTNLQQDKSIFVRSNGKLLKITLSQLWLIEGLKDYLRLWVNDERIIIHKTMKNFEEELSEYPNFVRIHKSFIININFINTIENNTIKINNQTLNIGDTYKSNFMRVFNEAKF